MNIKTILTASAALFAISSPALAGSVTGQLPVTATVLNNCTVSATAIAFGTQTNVGASNSNGQGSITVTCTPLTLYTVSLNNGNYADAGQRRMRHQTDTTSFLPYNIYSDSARTKPWGDTSGTTVSGLALLGGNVLQAYGQIPAGAQSGASGDYADSVTITVSY